MDQTPQEFTAPLAERVRPGKIEAILGQKEILGKNATLSRLIEKDGFNALILWGPPGTGKTTLANTMAKVSGRDFVALSAVRSGVKEIREHLDQSAAKKAVGEKALLLFMDEIHRLNKAQQDVLLPALESGDVKFIGATTENPSFEVNKAILSRCLVFRFKALSPDDLVLIQRQALNHPNAGLGNQDIGEDLLKAIANSADGDARRSLNLLEAVILSCPPGEPVSIETFKQFSADFVTKYDKDGDQHYDIISAMIKSIRASHPDAAVYYLARMIDAGEDPMFLARRLVIAASEDIGNANPMALLVATAAMQAAHMVGYPEARIILGQAATYLASSPKSNKAYEAIEGALADVRERGSLEIPMHLRNAPTKLMKEFGYGKYYAYAHSDLEGAKKLSYLPAELKGKKYYLPTDVGVEKQIKETLSKLRPQAD